MYIFIAAKEKTILDHLKNRKGLKMIFNVNNRAEAVQFDRVLKAKGWEYKYSIFYSRVYEKDGKTVFIHKSEKYKAKAA